MVFDGGHKAINKTEIGLQLLNKLIVHLIFFL